MESLGGCSLSNPVDQTWQSLREAVLSHPRVSGARFDHDIKRVDLMVEKGVVPSRRRISALVVVDADGTRVVISGAGKKGLPHQVATELLADVTHRLGGPAPEVASPSTPLATFSDEVSEEPHVSPIDRTPRTPPAPPPPPSLSAAPRPPAAPRSSAAPRRPPAAPPLAAQGDAHETASDDALSELAGGTDWR